MVVLAYPPKSILDISGSFESYICLDPCEHGQNRGAARASYVSSLNISPVGLLILPLFHLSKVEDQGMVWLPWLEIFLPPYALISVPILDTLQKIKLLAD